MPEVRVDMSAADDTLPKGPYKFAVTDFKINDSKSSQYKYIRYTHTVQEGPDAGRKLRDNISLSPGAAFRVKMWLGGGLGLAEDDYMPLDPETNKRFACFDPADHQGMIFIGIVDDSTDPNFPGSVITKYMTEEAYAALLASDEGLPFESGDGETGGKKRRK